MSVFVFFCDSCTFHSTDKQAMRENIQRSGAVSLLCSVLFITWSTEPVATTGLVELNAMHVTKCECASIVFIQRPDFKSQIFIVLSSEALSRNLPDGWNTSPLTQLSWPIYSTCIKTEITSERLWRLPKFWHIQYPILLLVSIPECECIVLWNPRSW